MSNKYTGVCAPSLEPLHPAPKPVPVEPKEEEEQASEESQ